MDYYVNLEHKAEVFEKYHKENKGAYRTSSAAQAGTSDKSDSVNKRFALRHRKKIHLKAFSVRSGMDMPFLFLVLILLTIGIIMMFSASYAYAYYTMGDSYYFLKKQLLFAVIGIICMFGISYFDYHLLHKAAVVILGLAFVLLCVVLVLPPVNYVHRWINIGFTMLQPSEIMKFALILFFAHWGSVYFTKMNTFKYGILPALCVLAPTILLLLMEPHYSCIVIVVLLTLVMLVLGGIKMKWVFVALGVALAAFLLAYATGILTYAMERMNGWGQALNYTTPEMWDDTWQTRNSLYAIGSGGLTGLGLGQSRQKYLYLPEPQNDFVFAIVCEELGIIGAVLILAIFGLLVWRGITVSLRAKDKFGMLLGVGLTAQVGIQVVINILVITDMLPNTGISLPFFSYGGSSLVMLLAQMGVVLSISRTASVNKT